MARKAKADAKLVRLAEERSKALAAFERWYTRMKRAFGKMEGARRDLKRIAAGIKRREEELSPPAE